ncbi:PIN domain-containing protein [Collimonas silvisoli]|uniref:PIN domain-containing protein n=1 Tax=Collimonas silvisoli TaxID=2825884 RepID=UPI0022A71025|nr:PIN domain-containing protein [Collimonas silvisoli]
MFLRTNFVLVDFENIQPKNMSLLNGGPFKIKVFVGANQAKIPLEMARALQVFGPDAEYIQIDGNGSNALDFHIAYYIGRLATETPDAYFHVISKDTGFDPLIKHLKVQKIFCQRSTSIADIPLLKISNNKSIPEKIEAVIDNLAKNKTSKPRTLKTLRSTIKSLFVNQLADDELDGLLEQLSKRGAINITDNKVAYAFPP